MIKRKRKEKRWNILAIEKEKEMYVKFGNNYLSLLRRDKSMFYIKIYILIDQQQVLIKCRRNCFFPCVHRIFINQLVLSPIRKKKNVNTKHNTLSFESEHDTGKSNILNTSGTNSRHVISLNSTWRVFMLRRRVIGRA